MRYLAFIPAGNHPAYCCNLSLPALPPSMQPPVQQLEHLAHLAHLAHPAQQLALAPLSSLFSPFSLLHGPIELSGQLQHNSREISVPSLITQSIIQSMQPRLQRPPPSCLRPLHAHHDVLPAAPLQACLLCPSLSRLNRSLNSSLPSVVLVRPCVAAYAAAC